MVCFIFSHCKEGSILYSAQQNDSLYLNNTYPIINKNQHLRKPQKTEPSFIKCFFMPTSDAGGKYSLNEEFRLEVFPQIMYPMNRDFLKFAYFSFTFSSHSSWRWNLEVTWHNSLVESNLVFGSKKT